MKIIKRKDKFYIVNKNKKLECFGTKEDAEYRLEQLIASELKRSNIIEVFNKVSNKLKKKGMIHISDALISCSNLVLSETPNDVIIIDLCRTIGVLRNKGEDELSEQLNFLLPDILSLKRCGNVKVKKNTNGVTADKVYKMVVKLNEKYLVGLIDKDTFEYKKMKEFKNMLQNGFKLPAPNNMSIPNKYNNWWEYFSKK